MAKQKLYQYLQGEKQGKIVSLTGVENEDNVTYLTFDDGGRCNVEFVAGLNNSRAYNEGKFIAEVCDRNNIWTFEKKIVKDDVRYGTLKDTGEIVAGWDPYTHGKDGGENKARVSVTAFPPRHTVTRDEMESGAKRLQELGISPDTPGYEEGMKSLTMPSQMDLQNKVMGNGLQVERSGAYSYDHVRSEVYDEKGNFLGKTTMNLDSATVKAPSAKDLAQYQRATEIYIPEDINESVSEPETVQQSQATQPLIVEKTDNITQKVEHIEEVRNTMIEQTVETKLNTASPIYSIVSKCKKKAVKIPLELEINIPSKSIFNLINDEYDEESVDEFFDIILAEIKTDDIKKCLREALYESYINVPEQKNVVNINRSQDC